MNVSKKIVELVQKLLAFLDILRYTLDPYTMGINYESICGLNINDFFLLFSDAEPMEYLLNL